MAQDMIIADQISMSFRMDLNHITSFKEWFITTIRHERKIEEFWALKNVSFTVSRGEVFGLIGRNGAGKSTILKVISGLLKPTTGKVSAYGRVVPMLELGSGFDMELSGTENIYLNGAILGFSKKFLDDRYQEIVEYSELGEFIHMPLKTYSSGMLARLAFSVGTMVEPEILIVDEILSVGDSTFQKKSGERMRALMSGGSTVLFVSHNIDQLESMCSRVMWLESGKIRMIGDSHTVCDAYRKEI